MVRGGAFKKPRPSIRLCADGASRDPQWSSMDDCIFCRLVRGEVPAHVILEDQTTLAFLDRHPINPGHVLVVPKRHEPDLFRLNEEEYLAVMRMVRAVSTSVLRATAPKRVGLLVAGWDVPHAHVHVVPMHDYHDLTSRQILEGTRGNPSDAELDGLATRLRTD
ncbi:MAG TPA: HIT domain-containing protein [Candidatus Eisenbacteria bacterium]|nr:HIT domain-containing protein [Candidatus Eisenbacteria bacterium]